MITTEKKSHKCPSCDNELNKLQNHKWNTSIPSAMREKLFIETKIKYFIILLITVLKNLYNFQFII